MIRAYFAFKPSGRCVTLILEPLNQLRQEQIPQQHNVDSQLYEEKLIGVVCPVPVTKGAVETGVPVEGEEEHRTVVVVGENVNDGMNHASKDEGQPPMSAGVGFVYKAPEEDGIDDEGGWRMQEIVRGNPPGVVEVQVVECTVHHP